MIHYVINQQLTAGDMAVRVKVVMFGFTAKWCPSPSVVWFLVSFCVTVGHVDNDVKSVKFFFRYSPNTGYHFN